MARPKYPSDETDKTMVRFTPGLMPRIKAAAEENGRSMNSEIVARLETSFERDSAEGLEKEMAFVGRIVRQTVEFMIDEAERSDDPAKSLMSHMRKVANRD